MTILLNVLREETKFINSNNVIELKFVSINQSINLYSAEAQCF